MIARSGISARVGKPSGRLRRLSGNRGGRITPGEGVTLAVPGRGIDKVPKAGMERTSKVLVAVHEERVHQDKKWGVQEHEPERWFTILLEELGEAAKAKVAAFLDAFRPGARTGPALLRDVLEGKG